MLTAVWRRFWITSIAARRYGFRSSDVDETKIRIGPPPCCDGRDDSRRPNETGRETTRQRRTHRGYTADAKDSAVGASRQDERHQSLASATPTARRRSNTNPRQGSPLVGGANRLVRFKQCRGRLRQIGLAALALLRVRSRTSGQLLLRTRSLARSGGGMRGSCQRVSRERLQQRVVHQERRRSTRPAGNSRVPARIELTLEAFRTKRSSAAATSPS